MYGIYANIYHQYPQMLAYIPAPWILWVICQYMSYLFQVLFFLVFLCHSMPHLFIEPSSKRRQGDEHCDLVTFNAAISACAKVAVVFERP